MTRAEIEWLLARGYQPEIPVLRFTSDDAERGDGGDGGSEAARPSPIVSGE